MLFVQGTTCLETGVYYINLKGCVECSTRGELAKAECKREEDEDGAEEISFERKLYPYTLYLVLRIQNQGHVTLHIHASSLQHPSEPCTAILYRLVHVLYLKKK